MEPLFETETEYTFERYTAFCKAVHQHIGHINRSLVKIVIAMVLCAVISHFLERDIAALSFLLAAIIFPVVLIWQTKKSVKKAWESNKAVQGVCMQYTFYDNHMEQKSALGNTGVEYEKLYDIIETEDAFYLMIGNNQGFMVEKENCSAQLQEFIRGHKKERRRRG